MARPKVNKDVDRANFKRLCDTIPDYLMIPRFTIRMRRGTLTMGYARHLIWYYAEEWCPALPQREIGKLLGKSKSGVIYGQQRIKNALNIPGSNKIKSDVMEINSILNEN